MSAWAGLVRWPISRKASDDLNKMQERARAQGGNWRQLVLDFDAEPEPCERCDGLGTRHCCDDGCDRCDYAGERDCKPCRGSGEVMP